MVMKDAEIQRNVIGVTVKDGVVTLVGTVESYTKKWNAEEIALRVAGVKAVVNNLEVKLSPGYRRSDEQIAVAARQTLECACDVPETVKMSI